MSFPLSAAKIAAITGAPLTNVVTTWPALQAAFEKRECFSDMVAVAAIATVRIECPPFAPIHEIGSTPYFTRMYDITGERPDKARELGNLEPGDGVLYAGRGLIQITGRANYRHYGQLLGVDLEADPYKALNMPLAAEIFALYFKNRGCCKAADELEWTRVRELVNGGHNQLDPFLSLVNRLLAELPANSGINPDDLAPPANAAPMM